MDITNDKKIPRIEFREFLSPKTPLFRTRPGESTANTLFCAQFIFQIEMLTLTQMKKKYMNAILMNLELQFQGNTFVNKESRRKISGTVERISRENTPPILDDQVTHADVFQKIKNLKNKKGPGISDTTNKILKILPFFFSFQIWPSY